MKYIGDCTDRRAIQKLAIMELSSLGLIIDPSVVLRAENGIVDTQISSVFGSDLSKVPSVFVTDIGPVPKFLVNSIQFLERHLDVEGIFRRSGSTVRLKDLRMLIEAGGIVTRANPIDVASLLKQFFRELPDPLLTSALYKNFIQCNSLLNCHERTAAILYLCLLLPTAHLATLRLTMMFLKRVAALSDLNKMDVANLAICLAPNILWNASARQKIKHRTRNVEDANPPRLEAEIAIVCTLISESAHIGMIPEKLLEVARRRDMTESYNVSDAALERSVLDSELSQTKKKKVPTATLR